MLATRIALPIVMLCASALFEMHVILSDDMKQKINTGIFVFVLLAATFCVSANAQENTQATQDSKTWLQKNLEDKEVVQTKSGLQYKVMKSTQGCFPDAREPVTIHYEASLVDNRVVDSSYQRGAPNTFALKKMIKAWKEGIPMMREGETWQFFAPPQLAYGKKGAPPRIGPDSVMIFRVELLKAGRCK
jgi:FKBP-type peptidyl-prolyl cis-trans isomerase FklB